jgi:type I restriction enzyme S subunit
LYKGYASGDHVHIPAIPPFEEQQAVASYLDSETSKLDARIAKRRRQIELLQEYKQALITDAVTGKIDVRGFNSSNNTGCLHS